MKRFLLSLALASLAFVLPARAVDTTRYTALSAVTTGTSSVYALNTARSVGLSAKWASGVTAGVVALEWAPEVDYSGTWQTLTTLDASTLTPPATHGEAVDVVGGFVRARITTTVSGGGSPSVTAYISVYRP